MISTPGSRPANPENGDASRRTWPREALRVGFGAVILVVAAVLLREHFASLEGWLQGLGRWAPLAFLVVHVVAVPFFFPVSVLGFLAGATFGFWLGTGILFVGGMVVAAIMFALARHVMADRVRRYASGRPRLARFLDLAEDDSTRLMILLRLSPLHFSLVSYLLGASRVRFAPYWLTSAFVLPSAALQAYVGRTAREVGQRSLSGEGGNTWETVAAVVAILAAVVLTVMLGRLARRALETDQGSA